MQYPTDKKYIQEAAIVAGLYIFAVLIKLLWININYSSPNNIFDGTYLITSNDGYRWLQHAKELYGGLSEPTDGLGRFRPVAVFAVYISKIVGIKYEIVAFYMPIYISSLGVVGIYALARLLGMQTAVLSAIFLAVSPGFFSRTMPGYFDDDMLNTTLPLFAILLFIQAVKHRMGQYPLLLSAISSFSAYWYPQSVSYFIFIAFFSIIFLFIYDKKNTVGYIAIFSILSGFLPIHFVFNLLIVSAALTLNHAIKSEKIKLFSLATIGTIGFFLFYKLYIGKLRLLLDLYVLKTNHSLSGGLNYTNTFISGVSETSAMGFGDFIFFVSGGSILFIISLAGVFLVVKHQKVLLPLMGMLFFGAIAIDGGNRFAPFAIPTLCIGLAYFFVYISIKTSKIWIHAPNTLLVLAGCAVISLNISTIYKFKVFPTLNGAEISTLKKVTTEQNKENTIFAWWDIGAPLRYYTKLKPHADSSLNQSNTIFVESLGFVSTSDVLTKNLFSDGGKLGYASTLDTIASVSSQKTANLKSFIELLANEKYIIAKNEKETFIVIRPKDLMGFNQIWNTYSGTIGTKEEFEWLFSISNQENEAELTLSGDVKIDKKNFSIKTANGKQKTIKAFYRIDSLQNGKSNYERVEINPNGELYLINAAPIGAMILCNDRALSTFLVRAYLFGEQNENLIKPILSENGIKVFKLVSPSSN